MTLLLELNLNLWFQLLGSVVLGLLQVLRLLPINKGELQDVTNFGMAHQVFPSLTFRSSTMGLLMIQDLFFATKKLHV